MTVWSTRDTCITAYLQVVASSRLHVPNLKQWKSILIGSYTTQHKLAWFDLVKITVITIRCIGFETLYDMTWCGMRQCDDVRWRAIKCKKIQLYRIHTSVLCCIVLYCTAPYLTILDLTARLNYCLHHIFYVTFLRLSSFRFVVNPTANSLDPVFYSSDCPVPWDVVDCVIVPHTVTPLHLHPHIGHSYTDAEEDKEGEVEGEGTDNFLSSTESQHNSSARGLVCTPGGPCPICLGELKIPRMTKCGHLFWYVFGRSVRLSATVCALIFSSSS